MRRQQAAIRDAFEDERNKPIVVELGAVPDTCKLLSSCLDAAGIAGLANAEGSAFVQKSYTCKWTGVGAARAVRCQYKKSNQTSERYPRQLQRGDTYVDTSTGAVGDVVSTVYNKEAGGWDTAIQFLPNRFHGVHHIIQGIGHWRHGKCVDIRTCPDGTLKTWALACFEVQTAIHRVWNRQNVRKQNCSV